MHPCRSLSMDVIASEAKQSRGHTQDWIASSQELLAMTELALPILRQFIGLRPVSFMNSSIKG